MDINALTNNSPNKKGGLIFLISYFAFAVYSLIAGFIVDGFSLTGNLYYVLASFPIILTALTVFFILPKEDRITNRHFTIKISPIYLLFAVLLAFTMLYGVGFTNGLVETAFNKLGVYFNGSAPSVNSLTDYIVLTVFVAIIPAVFEEIIFRGLLLKSLKCNYLINSLIVALCFSLYHGTIVKLIYQFVFGVVLSLLVYASKSLIPSIIAHFLNNFIILTFYYMGITDLPLYVFIILPSVAIIGVIFVFLVKSASKKIQNTKESVKDFFLPYGILGIVSTLITIIGGVL